MKLSYRDKVFNVIVIIVLTFALLATLYPLIYVASASVSDPYAVASGQVWLFPVNITFDGYQSVFQSKDIVTGFINSIIYTVFNTIFGVVFTVLAAYPLSRKDFHSRGFFMLLFSFTMFFSGGLIPTYLLINSLKLVNTRLIMVMGMSVYNIIITRTYFQSNIPTELLESAQLDGCSDFRFLAAIALPLSKPILAVVAMYFAVAKWNAFFDALIYLSDRKLFPLQITLREILIQNTADPMMMIDLDPREMAARQQRAELLKYVLIVVASVPVLCIYPFIQKYFVKGVMIGALKG